MLLKYDGKQEKGGDKDTQKQLPCPFIPHQTQVFEPVDMNEKEVIKTEMVNWIHKSKWDNEQIQFEFRAIQGS